MAHKLKNGLLLVLLYLFTIILSPLMELELRELDKLNRRLVP